jgi:hypothetical protein
MGVDFNRISQGISSGTSNNGFGSIVSFPSVPVSFPEYGTLVMNHPYWEKTVAQGGSYVDVGNILYPNSIWNVNELADGIGGTFFDWANAVFQYYKTDFISQQGYSSDPIIIDSVNYGSSCYTTYDVYHDGFGGTSSVNYMGGCTSSGTYITNGSIPTYINISGTNYQNGYVPVTYYHDGSGGYYQSGGMTEYYTYGSLITQITGVPIYLSLYTNTGSYYVGQFQNGTRDVDYFHDGYGGYYESDVNTYYTESGLITEYYFQSDVAGQLHNDGRTAVFYFQPPWNGYYSIAEYLNYYSYGTYVWDDGYAYHYWDGNGGYYTNYYF